MPDVEAVKQRAEAGKEFLESQRASGEPGTPNKHADETRASAEETLKQIDELTKKSEAPQRGPAATATDYHSVPAHERTTAQQAPASTSQLDSAALALGAARAAVTTQLQSDARLMSDPRYERDQKIYEMGKQGKLGMVPPSEAEKAAQAARVGLPPEVVEKIPSTPSEQVSDDMKRLQEAEKRSKELNPTITAGEQDGEKKNNFTAAKDAGANTGDRAPKDNEARAFDTGSGRDDVIK